MEQIYNDFGQPLDMSKLELLSDQGSEFIVYRYYDLVIKIYKEDYKLTHLSLEELRILQAIPTSRILLPAGFLWNNMGQLRGYAMTYIDDKNGEINIDDILVSAFFAELEVLREDVDLLCSHGIILRDINLSNTIYNGQIFLVDPGNYLVGEIKPIASHLDMDSLSSEDIAKLIRDWNYKKINLLIDLLLFSKRSLDSFTHWQIIQFFIKVKEENGIIYNLDALKMYFNPDLNVGEAINDFIKENIKDDPQMRSLILSLYGK